MAHPRMYSDDDPFLSELRTICLGLPEATEVEAWGRPTFRAPKMFAVFTGSAEDRYSVNFKPMATSALRCCKTLGSSSRRTSDRAAGWRSTSRSRRSIGTKWPS